MSAGPPQPQNFCEIPHLSFSGHQQTLCAASDTSSLVSCVTFLLDNSGPCFSVFMAYQPHKAHAACWAEGRNVGLGTTTHATAADLHGYPMGI